MQKKIEKALVCHQQAVEELKEKGAQLQKIAKLCRKALKKKNKIFFFGNGGSAADAQHLAAEFVGRFQKNREPLAALALSVNTSILTAVGNDFGFETIFSRQISALAKPGDIAIGFSTSGKSANITKALLEAKKLGLTTIAFLGKDGGETLKVVDVALLIPAAQTPRIQEMHILAGHIICELIEDEN